MLIATGLFFLASILVGMAFRFVAVLMLSAAVVLEIVVCCHAMSVMALILNCGLAMLAVQAGYLTGAFIKVGESTEVELAH